MRGRFLASLACLLGLSGGFAGMAYAAHPLTTEDPDTQGEGGHQIEINTDWLRLAGAARKTASFTYTYGITEQLDLFIGAPISLNAPSGLNDTALGMKWRLLEADAYSVALKPELSLPTGDEMKSLGTGRTSATLTAVFAYDATPWRLIGNIGASINRYKLQADRDANRSVTWRASASVWYAVRDRLSLVTDLGVERDTDRSSNALPAFFIAGLIYSPTQKLDLDAGVRIALNCGQCDNQPRRQVGVGLTCRF